MSLNINEGPGTKVSMADELEPCFLGGESRGCMEVPNCGFYADELVDVVDGFVWGRPLAPEH